MKCKYCANIMREDADFCLICGVVVGSEEETPKKSERKGQIDNKGQADKKIEKEKSARENMNKSYINMNKYRGFVNGCYRIMNKCYRKIINVMKNEWLKK